MIEFETTDDRAHALAEALSRALEPRGWYINFPSDAESFIVFPGRVFRYRRGAPGDRAEAQEFGRRLGIPEPQLEWTVGASSVGGGAARGRGGALPVLRHDVA